MVSFRLSQRFFQRPFHVFLLICFWEPFWEKTLSNYLVSCEVLFVTSDCQCRMVFPIPFFYLVYVKYTLLYSISNWERCICICEGVLCVNRVKLIRNNLKYCTNSVFIYQLPSSAIELVFPTPLFPAALGKQRRFAILFLIGYLTRENLIGNSDFIVFGAVKSTSNVRTYLICDL